MSCGSCSAARSSRATRRGHLLLLHVVRRGVHMALRAPCFPRVQCVCVGLGAHALHIMLLLRVPAAAVTCYVWEHLWMLRRPGRGSVPALARPCNSIALHCPLHANCRVTACCAVREVLQTALTAYLPM